MDREAKLFEIFRSVDTNGDGSINKREMIKFCRTSPELAVLLGLPEQVRQEDGSRDLLERRFQAMDRDDDREITWEEFLDFFAEKPAAQRDWRASGALRDFEEEFEEKHQAWLEREAEAHRAEEDARAASLRDAQRIVSELSENPFELIPALELPDELLAHLQKDLAKTLHVLHKESARNLERLKFHVKQWDVAPRVAREATSRRRLSTPDVQRQGLKAPWTKSSEDASPVRDRRPTPQGWPPLQVGQETITGRKRGRDWMNQDASIIVPLSDSRLLVGVFDGHGEQGHHVSGSVAELFSHFQDTEAFPRSLAQFFAYAQDGLRRGGLAEWSGTTATVALIDAQAGSVVCGYVGDSRMVICQGQRVLFETDDHDIDPEAEGRIRAAGGEVRGMCVSGIDAQRVFLRGSDIPGLSMSRALGDLQASAVGVLNEPSIHTCVQIPAGSAVIVASDGLWEKVSSEEAAAIVAAMDEGAAQAAKALVAEARSRWILENSDVDDITAIVVHFPEP